jgi:hypothetical protein
MRAGLRDIKRHKASNYGPGVRCLPMASDEHQLWVSQACLQQVQYRTDANSPPASKIRRQQA